MVNSIIVPLLSEGKMPFFFLTFHGTLLSVDPENGIFCHKAFTDNRHGFRFLTIDEYQISNIVGQRISSLLDYGNILLRDDMQKFLYQGVFANGILNHSISVKCENYYWTADPDFQFSCRTSECLKWETFFIISLEDLNILRKIKSSFLYFDDDISSIIDYRRISPGIDFSFHVGNHEIDIPTNLPLSKKFTGVSFDFVSKSKNELVSIHLLPDSPPNRDKKRIWIKPMGNIGNRALQYLVAEGMRKVCPEAEIENINLPEWGVDTSTPQPTTSNSVKTGDTRYWMDVKGIADCLRRGVIDAVIINSYAFNIDFYPSRAISKKLLGPTCEGGDAKGFGPEFLVCSVRAGEILAGIHKDYLLLPPGYYRLLAQITGLDLVFYGQLGDDPYSESLRSMFPKSLFVSGTDPQYDFDMLRRSVNLAPSISTFAWLAAWLSEASKIYMPVGGMFNPIQHPNQMYLPLDDPSYEFILLPYTKAINVWKDKRYFIAQQELVGYYARPVDRTELRDICTRATLIYPHKPFVGGFDVNFYLSSNPNSASKICSGSQSALQNYLDEGFLKERFPLEFDEKFYINAYPHAAMEISQGHFVSPLHHYTAVGWSRNYLTIPPPTDGS